MLLLVPLFATEKFLSREGSCVHMSERERETKRRQRGAREREGDRESEGEERRGILRERGESIGREKKGREEERSGEVWWKERGS